MTHVFSASTDDECSRRWTTAEIAEARWGTADELAGPIRERLLATDRALWRYRVALTTRRSSRAPPTPRYAGFALQHVPGRRTSSSVVRSCPIASRMT